AGRDDDAALGGELGEAFPFPLAKAPLALLLEDERDINAGAPLDLGVAVEEAEAQRLRELAADSRLAGAHRADQIDVGAGGQRVPRPGRRRTDCQKRRAGAMAGPS